MIPGRIAGATHAFRATKGWDRTREGACGTLILRADQTCAGPGLTSAWYPNLDEIERIARGAPIYLTVIGGGRPPVCMAVGPAPE